MRVLVKWPGLLLALCALLCLFRSVLASPGWTVRRKLDAREKTRSLWYHGFRNYMTYAFPLDELMPLSCTGKGPDMDDPTNISYNDVAGNFSLTLIDVLDTLVILDDYPGFEKGVRDTIDWVSFDVNTKPQVFETTIRVLGGLLSAHQFAAKKGGPFYLPWYEGELLHMAKDLGERLLPAFSTPTGLPFARINLRHGMQPGESLETCTAGAGSLILEFATLSRLTGDDRFEKAAHKAYFALWNRRSDISLVANTINIWNGKWQNPEITSVGAGIDSFFEYALKFYILSGDVEFLDVWTEAYAAIMRYARHMNGFTFSTANIHTGDTAYWMTDSLSAFWPGLQVLAGDIENAIKSHQTYWNIWKMYSGLPEVFDLNHKVGTSMQYPLRPEFIESTWYLYRATRDPFYLDVGERVLHDLFWRAKSECGLAGIANLETNKRDDRMESFVLSETLKYLYLLFDEENPVNSDDSNYVFTTEGHILFMETEHIRPLSATRRKLRGPEKSQCPAYRPWLMVEDYEESLSGLHAGLRQRSDVEYARTLVGAPFNEADAVHWSAEGWCQVPPISIYTYDFILSPTGKLVPEDTNPSSRKVAIVVDGYAVHNITGLRAHIVSRIDGRGYDLTKIGPYPVRSGQLVYFDDPELLSMMEAQNPVEEPIVRRRSDIHLHFLPDFMDPIRQSQQLLIDDVAPEEVVITACTASFGGNPSGTVVEGIEPLVFGHGDGVPIIRGWNNTLGCTPYSESFHGEAILVHRGECTFLEKLVHALNAGASGVVAINVDDSKVWPSAGAEEIADAGTLLDTGALVVVTRSAGKTLERMLDAAEDLDGNLWMAIGAEPASSDPQPMREPTQTQREPSSGFKMLYINGHSLINTRMG